MRYLALTFLLLLLALPALLLAQCQSGSCAPAVETWRWQHFDGSTTQVALLLNERQHGVYVYAEGQYYRRTGPGQWQAEAAPVTPPECPCGECGCKNFGVQTSAIRPGRVTLNGVEISRPDAVQALGATLPDDAQLQRLTVIGTESERKRVLADLLTAPELAPYRGRVVIKDYDPSHWAMSCGFVTSGSPTVYLQSADGTVLHRQDSYDGPRCLATALRRAQPDYDPTRDPDLCKPKPAPPAPQPDPQPAQPDPAPVVVPQPQPRPASAPLSGWALVAFGVPLALGAAALYLRQKGS